FRVRRVEPDDNVEMTGLCRGAPVFALGGSPMNRCRISGMYAMAAFGMSLLAGSAAGQQKSLAEQLLGTWTLVSHESTWYGVNPKGVAFFDAGGRFIITVMRSDRAKYAIGHPAQGTDDENKATTQGVMTYFGT